MHKEQIEQIKVEKKFEFKLKDEEIDRNRKNMELLRVGVGVKMVQSQKPLGTILNKHIYGKYEMFEVSGQNFKF